ncbi:hypothetical protein ACG2F4_03925 [Halalkalibaculum sp. DA3122]|uniref:hypothetical protein n=1 Tax=unclassified Halalkalibaculum TaxID=2964617 RepID=UPI0037551EB7
MRSDKIRMFCLLTWAALSFTFLSVNAQSPSFDYLRHPKLDFSFNHLALELNIDPEEKLLVGQATYEIEANIGGVDSLVLNAAHMDIRAVLADGKEVPYRLGNDSLFVALGETTEPGSRYSVEILYETSPKFGVHFEPDGSVWSSSLPLTTRHWLPVADHPRVTFTTDITLAVPGNFTALAPGRTGTEAITSVEEKQVQWQSRRPVPASALWFATGPFTTAETSFGIKQIRVSGDTVVMDRSGKKLLESAYQILDRTEKALGVEYPFETLNIMLMDDHRWESKPYAAGAVFLFANRGGLQAQLRRGILAQWYGVHQREEQWSDAEAMNLYQTVLNQQLAEGTASIADQANPAASINPYHAFSVKRWNRWQQFYQQWENTTWKQVVEQSLDSEPASGGGVKTWNDYADSWYQQSGQPWFSPPQLIVNQETGEQDSIIYRVDYQYDETSGELVLNFEAQDSVVSELITLPLVEHTMQGADTLEVTFTGKSDSIMLNLDPLVSYVTIDGSAREDITLIEYKPIPFVLSQLRNAESSDEKVAAAHQLANHSDNPDLQLAINDLLEQEQPPTVKAALLYSMGEITKGATGTEQQFIEALNEDHAAVQEAAIRALRYYQGNDQVIQTIQRTALQSDSVSLFRQATNSLFAVVDSSDTSTLNRFSQQVMSEDSTGNRAVFVFRKLARQELADSEVLVKNLVLLTGHNYDFPVRAAALEILKKVDTSENEWSSRIETMLADSDPRIRFLAVRAAADLEFIDAENILGERLLDEYDGRVFYEMQKIAGGR